MEKSISKENPQQSLKRTRSVECFTNKTLYCQLFVSIVSVSAVYCPNFMVHRCQAASHFPAGPKSKIPSCLETSRRRPEKSHEFWQWLGRNHLWFVWLVVLCQLKTQIGWKINTVSNHQEVVHLKKDRTLYVKRKAFAVDKWISVTSHGRSHEFRSTFVIRYPVAPSSPRDTENTKKPWGKLAPTGANYHHLPKNKEIKGSAPQQVLVYSPMSWTPKISSFEIFDIIARTDSVGFWMVFHTPPCQMSLKYIEISSSFHILYVMIVSEFQKSLSCGGLPIIRLAVMLPSGPKTWLTKHFPTMKAQQNGHSWTAKFW